MCNLESLVLKKIKVLEDDPSKSEIKLEEFGSVLSKCNNKYLLKGSNRQLIDPQFRFLVTNKVEDGIEISLPSAEECYSMASELDPQSRFELDQIAAYGSELLYKLSVGILQVDQK
jgi:hypothetical protein